MQNPHKDELFALVKSLSQAEKRYVTLHSPHNGDTRGKKSAPKKYLELFQAMCELKHYEEKRFKHQHAGKAFLENLPTVKNYLKNHILAAMRSYEKEPPPEVKIFNLLRDYAFLREKGHYQFARKQLRKARKIAEEAQIAYLLLEINREESAFEMEHTDKKQNIDKIIVRNDREWKSLLEQQKTEFTFLYEHHNIFRFYTTGQRERLEIELDRLVQGNQIDAVLSDPESHSYLTRLSCLKIRARYEEFHRQPQDQLKTNREIVQLIENEGFQRSEDTSLIAKALSNYLNSCHALDKYEEYETIFAKMRVILDLDISREVRGEVLQNLYLHQILLYLNRCQWEKVAEMQVCIRQFLIDYAEKVNPRRKASLQVNVLIASVMLDQWHAVREWYDTIMQAKKEGLSSSQVQVARTIDVLYFMEKLNGTTARHRIRSAKSKIIQEEQKILYAGLHKINEKAKGDRRPQYRKLHEELRRRKQNRELKHIKGGEIVFYYVTGKALNIPTRIAFQRFGP
ncbi:MAG: hypothetical protein AAGN35_06575 [Bacteroidota bacterium]